MKETFTYRHGTIEDVGRLRELGLGSYGEFGEVLTGENWTTLSSFLRDQDTWNRLVINAHCFICAENDRIVGMAFLVPHGNPTKIYPADWSYIRMVGVAPKHRGKGIGRRLIVMCIDFARESHEQTVALHTSEFMHAARHIYESLGFIRTKEIDPIYGKRYWLYKLDI